MNEAFAYYYNAGDLNKLLSLYESTAIHVTKEGKTTAGIANIKKDLQLLLGLNGHMTSVNLSTVVNGNIALLQAEFVLRDKSANVIAHGITSEVLRKQPDGSWKYIIDRPFSQAG
jgi:ketosteroid isomerase-like protein